MASVFFHTMYAFTVAVCSNVTGPVAFERPMRRDTSVRQRPFAVNAGDRIQVASDISNALMAEEIDADRTPLPDAFDDYFDNLASGVPAKKARTLLERALPFDDIVPEDPTSDMYFDRAGENATRPRTRVGWTPRIPHVAVTVASFAVEKCERVLGFTHDVLYEMIRELEIPAMMRTPKGDTFTGQEGLCLLLQRLKCRHITYETLKEEYNRDPSRYMVWAGVIEGGCGGRNVWVLGGLGPRGMVVADGGYGCVAVGDGRREGRAVPSHNHDLTSSVTNMSGSPRLARAPSVSSLTSPAKSLQDLPHHGGMVRCPLDPPCGYHPCHGGP